MGDLLRPAFPVERRGYDRVQVDRYLDSVEYDVETLRSQVEKLQAELEGTRRRAETAPEDPASLDRHAPVSDHVAQLTQALDEEIGQLRAQANEEVEQLRAQANEEVEQLRAQANEEVERRLSEVRADADRIRADAESKANEVGRLADDGLSHLKDRRRSLYGKLRRIRNAIDGALSELDPEIDEERPADEVVLLLGDDGSDERVDQ